MNSHLSPGMADPRASSPNPYPFPEAEQLSPRILFQTPIPSARCQAQAAAAAPTSLLFKVESDEPHLTPLTRQ